MQAGMVMTQAGVYGEQCLGGDQALPTPCILSQGSDIYGICWPGSHSSSSRKSSFIFSFLQIQFIWWFKQNFPSSQILASKNTEHSQSRLMRASPGTFPETIEEMPFPLRLLSWQGINLRMLVATLGTPRLECFSEQGQKRGEQI